MENKRVTHTTRLLLRLWNTGWFAWIWFEVYNYYVFDTYRVAGGIFSVFIFYLIYTALCNVYKAFRIASTNMTEITFSHFISFASADLLLYIEACLIFNQYINVFPGLRIVGIQLAGTIVIAIVSKRYFITHIRPQPTMLIYGTRFGKQKGLETAQLFEKRLMNKYKHLFRVILMDSEEIDPDDFIRKLDKVDTVIMYHVSTPKRTVLYKACLERQKNYYFTPGVSDVLDLGCEPKHLLDTPLMKYEYRYENRQKNVEKRVLDIVFSLFFIILFSPLMLVTAACIKLEDGGPVFFRQARCTKNRKVFEILKFRSMVVDAEKYGVIPSTENDPRITKVGRIIRAARIDELPQFFNILAGDMSFVGPRPERVEHVDLYTKQIPEFSYRLMVKGGLTGYAQIFGKYNTSAYDKLLLDLMYIENQSTLLDLKLMLLTIRTVFQKESTEGFDEETSREIQEDAMHEVILEAHEDTMHENGRETGTAEEIHEGSQTGNQHTDQ